MSCYWCRHWRKVSEEEFDINDIVGRVKRATGECRRYPAQQKTTGLYYCSELSLESPRDAGDWWRGLHDRTREADAAKKEVRRLKAVAKDLRRKLRERTPAKP